LFKIFKSIKKAHQDELTKVLLLSFDELARATKKNGFERQFRYSVVFASLLETMGAYFPNVPIEEDGPAMNILTSGSDNPDWPSIDQDIEYVFQQVSNCPKDHDFRVIVMRGFLSPRYVEEKFEMLSRSGDQV
jgi:hypothetical protein